MILSLLTGGITVINAASFILLAPNAYLATYIGCSAIYSVGCWVIVWVLPAATEYDANRLTQLRAAQLLACLATCILLLALSISWISVIFCLILAFEMYFFVQRILLLDSCTPEYQRLELFRALANSAVLAICVLAFSGNAFVMASGILVTTLLTGFASLTLKLGRPPLVFSIAAYRLDTLLDLCKVALSSVPVRMLIAARCVEVTALMTAVRFAPLDVIVGLKLGITVCSVLSSNARSRSFFQIAAIGSAVFLLILVGIQFIVDHSLFALPRTISSLKVESAFSVVPVMLLFSFFLYRSMSVK